jgi:hypothetical protein
MPAGRARAAAAAPAAERAARAREVGAVPSRAPSPSLSTPLPSSAFREERVRMERARRFRWLCAHMRAHGEEGRT